MLPLRTPKRRFHVWVIPGNQEAQHTPPSVIIVVVLGDEDVVLLEQRREVLADLSPHIQEGHHYQSNPDKTEGGLLPPGVTETTELVHQAACGWCIFTETNTAVQLLDLFSAHLQPGG